MYSRIFNDQTVESTDENENEKIKTTARTTNKSKRKENDSNVHL